MSAWIHKAAEDVYRMTHADGWMELTPEHQRAEIASAIQLAYKSAKVRAPKAAQSEKATRIPDGFPSAADRDWAQEAYRMLPIKEEADKFRDYWTAKAGKDARKLDWPATWRNWIRTANGRWRGAVSDACAPQHGRKQL